jgi:hypothetical protein
VEKINYWVRSDWEILVIVFVFVFRGAPGGEHCFESGLNRSGEAASEVLFSPSDNARSCFMISAFSDLFAFLGSPAITLAVIAHRTSAVATPISSMLSMDTGLPTKWAGGWFN